MIDALARLPRGRLCVLVDHYVLDESGHGGDLASAKDLDFAGQPFFALACVGVADAALLTVELDRLRAHYACGEGELKSSKLGKKLHVWAYDFVEGRTCGSLPSSTRPAESAWRSSWPVSCAM